jgi:hypothetical protein
MSSTSAAVRMPPTASTGIDTRRLTAWKRLRFQTGRKGAVTPPVT